MLSMVFPRRFARLARLGDSYRPDVHIPVDVVAENDSYHITAILPGVEPDDVNIEILGDTVTISGEFNSAEDEGARYLLRERPSGHFSRVLRFSSELDAAKAEAEVKNGQLSLRLQKAESAMPKQIAVKAK